MPLYSICIFDLFRKGAIVGPWRERQRDKVRTNAAAAAFKCDLDSLPSAYEMLLDDDKDDDGDDNEDNDNDNGGR